MKDFFKGMAVITLALVLIPAMPLLFQADFGTPSAPVMTETTPTEKEYTLIETVSVHDVVKQETFTMSIEDYLVASLFSHLEKGAHPELIKAQTVIIYTYILGRRIDETQSPTPELYGADISTDSSKYLSLMLSDEAMTRYDEEYYEMLKTYKSLISEVLGAYCAYDGEPIQPAFCRSSGGKTQSALTVLGEDVPYLRSVASECDKEFVTDVSYTSAEVFARISTSGKGYTLYIDPSQWIKPSVVTSDGYIVEICLDNSYTVSGRWFANVLNLPSAKFSVSYSIQLDRFTFTVYGNGHLVGFSQYGAQRMAEKGTTWQELLEHYYAGIEVCGAAE